MRDEPVGHLARDLDHAGPEAADVHRGATERVGPGIERRDHQRVPVEVALERERLARLPRRADRVERPHDLVHAARRLRPGRAEAVHDVRAHLRAQPEQEAATGDELQVVAEVGEVHRVARERDRDRGAELHRGGVLGGDRERDERIVLGLEGEDAVVPDLLEPRVRRSGRRADPRAGWW